MQKDGDILMYPTEHIEKYQLKMFYYQSIPGIWKFRFSVTEESTRFYIQSPQKTLVDISKSMVDEMEIKEVFRQIIEIINQGQEYLLYEENYVLNPEKIIIESNNPLKVALIYLPIRRENFQDDLKKRDIRLFLSFFKTIFKEKGWMEGFYLCSRLEEESEKEKSLGTILKSLEDWLEERSHKMCGKNKILFNSQS